MAWVCRYVEGRVERADHVALFFELARAHDRPDHLRTMPRLPRNV